MRFAILALFAFAGLASAQACPPSSAIGWGAKVTVQFAPSAPPAPMVRYVPVPAAPVTQYLPAAPVFQVPAYAAPAPTVLYAAPPRKQYAAPIREFFFGR